MLYSGLSVKTSAKDKFIIVTTWHDRSVIMSSLAYHRLKNIMPVEFHLIDGLADLKDSYNTMSYCYASAMKNPDVIQDETYFVFLTPDSFWSEGMFARLKELRDDNYKVAIAIGIRMSLEPLLPIYRDLISQQKDGRIHLPYSVLIEHLIKYAHPTTSSSDLLSNEGFPNQWPSNLYWINSEEKQMIVHGFHLHPLMVKAPAKNIKMGDTVDGKFLKNLNYALSDYYIFQNQHFGLELTSISRKWDVPLESPSISKIIDFSYLHASHVHFHFFKHRLVFGERLDVDPVLNRLITETVDKIVAARSKRVYVFTSLIKRAVKSECKRLLLMPIQLFMYMKSRLIIKKSC